LHHLVLELLIFAKGAQKYMWENFVSDRDGKIKI
jgi:hypothetical protein